MSLRNEFKFNYRTNSIIIAVTGFLLTTLLSIYLYSRIKTQEKIRFDFEVSLLLNEVYNRIEHYENTLIQTRAFILNTPNITNELFQSYSNNLDLQKRYPGVQGLGYVSVFKSEDLDKFEKRISGDQAGFRVWPRDNRDLYTSIIFLEPRDRRNLKAIGFDMFTESSRRKAMEDARDTGQAVISGAVKLVQEEADSLQPGFNMYLPVYKKDSSLTTIEERRGSLQGYVYSPFRAQEFFNEIYKISKPLLVFKVYGGLEGDKGNLLYSRKVKEKFPNSLQKKVMVEFGHRKYLFVFKSLPYFQKNVSYQAVIYTIIVGLVITMLVLFVVNVLRSRSQYLEKSKQAIANTRENFNNLFEKIPELVCITRGPNHVFEYVNLAHIKAIGQNAIGKTLVEAQPASVELRALFDEVYKTGKTLILHEYEITISKLNKKKSFNMTFSPHRDEFGVIDGVMSIAADVTEEVNIRKKLKEKTENLAFAHRNAKMGSWSLDLETNTVTQSAEVMEMMRGEGERLEEELENVLEDMVYSEDRKLVADELEKSITTNQHYYCEHRMVKSDGEIRWVLSQGHPIYAADGRPLSISGVIMDITDRKKSELELTYQLQLTKIITDNAASSLFVIDYKGFPTFMNPAAEKLTGFTLDEIIDKPLHFSIHGLKMDGSYYSIDDCPVEHAHREQKAIQNGEEVFIDKFGRFYPVSYSVSPLRKGEEVLGSVLEFKDISEEKKRQKQLEILAETSVLLNSHLSIENKLSIIPDKVRQIVDCHQALIVLYDNDNKIDKIALSCSSKYEHFDEKEFVNCFPCEELFNIKNPMRKTSIDNKNPIHNEEMIFFPLIRSDGRNLGVIQISDKYTGSFNRGDESLIVQLTQIASSAIENIQLLKNEQEAVKSRDEFLSIASHELKTPLTSLSLQAQIYERGLEKEDEEFYSKTKVKKLVTLVSRQIGRLTRLIDDMLDVSRISSNKLSIDKHVFDLSVLIEEMIERLSTIFINNSLEVPSFEPIGNAIGYWDRFRIEQVIENLITNAIRYGNGKPVTISLSASEDAVRLSVKDQGMGISQQAMGKIFNRFERSVDASEVSGLGLGLFISKQIVIAHKGRIWVESEIGKGSNFIIELPKNSDEKS